MRSRRHRGEGSPADRIAHLANSAGAPVDEVLREVADFRLALETDMIIAAAAVDADEIGLAAEVVDGDRAGLAAFHERMLSRLVEVARDEAPAKPVVRVGHRTRVRLLAAAAGLVALLGGGAAVTSATARTDDPTTKQVALALADDQLSTLTGEIVRDASTAEISTAADELHDTLATLIAEHAEGDPAVALLIAELIREEEQLLRVERTPATRSVLRDMARLVRQLKRVAPPKVDATLPPVAPEPTPAASSSPKASAKPTPKPSPSSAPASASPRPSASSSPRPSASSSSGGSDGEESSNNPLPTARP